MGEMAEDYLDGSCCSDCGSYFVDNQKKQIRTHDYPVVCRNCWAEANQKQRQAYKKAGLQRAIYKT